MEFCKELFFISLNVVFSDVEIDKNGICFLIKPPISQIIEIITFKHEV